MAAAVASGLAKSAFSHAPSTVSPAIASRQPNAEPGMSARVASSNARVSSARCSASRSRRAKRSRAHHPAKATISTRTTPGTLLPPPPARTKASAQASTRTAPMATTAHTGSDTTPVKAVAHSPTRSSMSHHSGNSMAQGGGGGHPRGSRGAFAITRAPSRRAVRLATCAASPRDKFARFAHARPRAKGPLPVCRMRSANSAGKFELAFPGHALERLIRIFDAVLVIGTVGGEQLHHLIGTIGDHVTNRTRREVDSLADLKLVFLQRGSPALERYGWLVLSGVPPIDREYSSEI